MNNLELARILKELFGPLLAKLIANLLERAAKDLAPNPVSGLGIDIASIFDGAKRQTWKWQFGRRAVLDCCCDIAVRRRAEVFAACAGTGPQPHLTRDEMFELAKLL